MLDSVCSQFACFYFDKLRDAVPLSGLMIYSSPLGVLYKTLGSIMLYESFDECS